MGRWGTRGDAREPVARDLRPPEPGSGLGAAAALRGFHSGACAIRDGDGSDPRGPRGGRSLLKPGRQFQPHSPGVLLPCLDI